MASQMGTDEQLRELDGSNVILFLFSFSFWLIEMQHFWCDKSLLTIFLVLQKYSQIRYHTQNQRPAAATLLFHSFLQR